jgi:hypothetical protein
MRLHAYIVACMHASCYIYAAVMNSTGIKRNNRMARALSSRTLELELAN